MIRKTTRDPDLLQLSEPDLGAGRDRPIIGSEIEARGCFGLRWQYAKRSAPPGAQKKGATPPPPHYGPPLPLLPQLSPHRFPNRRRRDRWLKTTYFINSS